MVKKGKLLQDIPIIFAAIAVSGSTPTSFRNAIFSGFVMTLHIYLKLLDI